MPCRATQDRWVMAESTDKTWSTGEENGKPLQQSFLENLMNNRKKKKRYDTESKLPRSVGSPYATGEEQRNSSRGNEVELSSLTQLCPTLCNPMNHSTPGLPVHQQSRSPHKPMSIELVMPSNHLILCHHLHLLPSIFPSIKVLSNESALHIRWPKYWSFSYNISPSK